MDWINLAKYLADPSAVVISLTEYLNIQAICAKMNTGLPTNVTEEHFGGLVFTLFH